MTIIKGTVICAYRGTDTISIEIEFEQPVKEGGSVFQDPCPEDSTVTIAFPATDPTVGRDLYVGREIHITVF